MLYAIDKEFRLVFKICVIVSSQELPPAFLLGLFLAWLWFVGHLPLLNICPVSFWLIHYLDSSNCVLKDQKLPFCSLEEDLLGIVAFDGSGNRLAS